MNGPALAWLMVYVPGAVVLGALASWPLWLALGAVGLSPGFSGLCLRTMEICALLALVPVLRRCGGGGARAWGYGPPANGRTTASELLAGLVAGIAMVAIPAAVLVALGARDLRETGLDEFAVIALKSAVTAVAVALLEETWFRGGLTTLMQRALGPMAALVLASAFYAALHFLDPPEVAAADVRWSSGLVVAKDVFAGMVIDDHGSALTLLVAGLVLGISRLRTGRIAFAIGMHAGWVFVIQGVRRLTRLDRTDPDSALVGSYDGVIGWLAAVAFLLTLAIALSMLIRRQQVGP